MPKNDFIELEKDYKYLIHFFLKEIKKLVIAAEKYDEDQNLSITAISELRSAFDHVMRAESAKYGVISEEEIVNESGMDITRYYKTNINKALGHLYRAGYDAYDIISIGLIDDIDRMLKRVSARALYTVLGDAKEKKEKYKKAKDIFIEAKLKKDVESAEVERKQFHKYEMGGLELFKVREQILSNMDQLIEFDKESKREKWIMISISFASGIIASGLVAILFYFFS